MPIKQPYISDTASLHYKALSYETLLASWLQQDGWEVFMPTVDHGMKTDVLISDGRNYYRIQVKSVKEISERVRVNSQWGNANIDYVVYFSREGQTGYITPPFHGRRKLVHPEHIRFHQSPKNFAKAFKRA